jgi:hypothetical protein
LLVSFVVIGWLLNGYSASQFVWFGTVITICYVIWVGTGAIALASVWVVGLMSIAAMNQAWLRDLPRPEFKFIPMMLLANWLLALGTVWWLGNVSDFFRQNSKPNPRVFILLIFLVIGGLTSGWHLYQQTLIYFPMN